MIYKMPYAKLVGPERPAKLVLVLRDLAHSEALGVCVPPRVSLAHGNVLALAPVDELVGLVRGALRSPAEDRKTETDRAQAGPRALA